MKWNVVGQTFSNQLSMCVNIANSLNGFVTRMGLLAESLDKPSEGDVCYSFSLVLLCTVSFERQTSLMLSVGL